MLLELLIGAALAHAAPVAAEAAAQELTARAESPKLAETDEPLVLLQNVPSAVDIRIQQATEEVVSHTGIKSNFTVAPANVSNALAYIGRGGDRLLLYNPEFMANVHARVCKDWGVYGVMAHEIGHHLQGHVLRNPDANFHRLELEADEFAGFVLYRMGASLEEAQRSTARLAQDNDTGTHPGKEKRLAAIEAGWLRARNIAADEYFNDQRRSERMAQQTQGSQ